MHDDGVDQAGDHGSVDDVGTYCGVGRYTVCALECRSRVGEGAVFVSGLGELDWRGQGRTELRALGHRSRDDGGPGGGEHVWTREGRVEAGGAV